MGQVRLVFAQGMAQIRKLNFMLLLEQILVPGNGASTDTAVEKDLLDYEDGIYGCLMKKKYGVVACAVFRNTNGSCLACFSMNSLLLKVTKDCFGLGLIHGMQ
jgi:hypothetical protein